MGTQTNIVSSFYLLAKLRWKYKDDILHNDALNKIVWYSFPVVYRDSDWSEVARKVSNRKQTKNRINKYLRTMFEMYSTLYFVTLTFNDEAFLNTTDSTRHRYASSFLNAISKDYFANVDYGFKNRREHYHAVVKLKNGLNEQIFKSWEYGFTHFEIIDTLAFFNASDERKNRTRIAKYICKLTNHAGKLTTGKCFHKRFKDGFREMDLEKELPF